MDILSAGSEVYEGLPTQINDIRVGDETDEKDELLESGDPELAQRKRLIEALWGKKNEQDTGRDKLREVRVESAKARDSVEISEKSLALYQQSKTDLVLERGNERLEVRFERQEMVRVQMQTRQGPEIQEAEPLVVDLGDNGLDLTDVRAGQGVAFDITGNGQRETVSWVAPTDGFLAYDRNKNGSIDSGKELFGDQHGAAHGFEELAKFDNNRDSRIDSQDTVFSHLRIWQDLNTNGISEQNELRALKDYGISAISLSPDSTVHTVAGNRVEGYSAYESTTGEGKVGEVFLNYLG